MKLYTTSEFISNDILFEKKVKKWSHYEKKLYTTSEFISTYTSFENKKNLSTKMKLYTTSE